MHSITTVMRVDDAGGQGYMKSLGVVNRLAQQLSRRNTCSCNQDGVTVLMRLKGLTSQRGVEA